jgi:Zn ribbon nucleic-acid-binding protein
MSSHDYDYDQRFVCAACFTDEGIQGFIEGALESNECSFCGAQANESIAAPFKDVAKHINVSLYQEYDDAANEMSYVTAEGGYLGQTWTTYELLMDVIELERPRDEDNSLFDALVDRLDQNAWCQKHPYSLTYIQETQFSWKRFCQVVKHQRRYFFRDDDKPNSEILSPGELLETILDYACKIGLIIRIEQGALKVSRARRQGDGETFTSPLDLGPPPQSKAIQSNRMSPAGVVMFYGSDQPETALRETAQALGAGTYAVGEFSNGREIVLLDLANLPDIPSLFCEVPDSMEYNPRTVLQFLHHVSRAISRPVPRDSREHIEYVPSQVVTEFVRSTDTGAGRIDGIHYASAVHPGAASYVLFADQDNVAVPDDTRPAYRGDDRWLHLVARSALHVSEADLGRWRNENQPVIDFSD